MYNQKYNQKDNKKFNKNTQSVITMAAISLAAFGLYGIETIDSMKAEISQQQQAEAAVHPDESSLNELWQKALKDTAHKYKASDIMNDYYDCPDTFNGREEHKKKYVDKYLEITGEAHKTYFSSVTGIRLSMLNDDPINFYTEFTRIDCYFQDKEDIELLKNIEPGDKVTVVGYCNTDLIWMDLQDCDILKINDKEITQ
jgi:hypothetical protein